MDTLLISIGISEYKSELLPVLQGAANDAIRISSFFNLWGVKKENIVMLLDSEATRENILRAIRVETLRCSKKIDAVFLYYAGHGENNTEFPMKPENILYCYDTSMLDTIGTGLRIQEIIDGMQRCQALKMFLFVDACYVQIRDLPDILPTIKKFEEEKRCFFALMSTWGKQAYEDAEGGKFTTQLIRGFAYLRNKNSVCTDIARYIENQALELNLPLPKGYWIGTSNIWFLDSLERNYKSRLNEEQYVNRIDGLIEITDKMLLAKYNDVCFYGNATSGKTILALQLSQYFKNFYYYSVKIYYSLEQTEAELAHLILEQFVQENGISKEIKNDSLVSVIEYIAYFKISIAIILDHAERLKKEDLNELLCKFHKGNVKIIAFSRISLRNCSFPISNIQCPDFSKKEFNHFLKNYNIASSPNEENRLYELYKNKPQQLIQYAKRISDNEIFMSCKQIIYYICECDGFVDLGLFCDTFNINVNEVIILINCGLVRKELERFVPHESLYEYYSYDKAAVLNSTLAEGYWQRQMHATPKNTFVCNLVLAYIKKKGIRWLEDPKGIFEQLTSYCLSKYKWEDLEVLYPYLIDLKYTDLIMKVSHQLAHVARSYILQFNDVLQEVLCDEDRNIWNAIRCEIFYWIGDFDECIKVSNDLLTVISLEDNLKDYVHLNLAIAYFFLGEWDLSNDNLNKVFESSKRMEGWKNLISGTIDAIRGVDFDKGISRLSDGIKILCEIDDIIGVGIAYGNLGECYLKKGEFLLAQSYLECGEKYTILSNDCATHLEILRNKLLVVMSESHAFDVTAEKIEDEILLLINKVSDKTELMQVYNTLSTASIYKYDKEKAKEYLEIVMDMTEGNLEYELYTCINAAAIAYIERNMQDVNVQLNHIKELFQKGQNYYAIYQCINTIYDVKKIYNLDEINLEIWEEIKGGI